MKKVIFITVFLITILISNSVYGTDTEEIIKEQEASLGISGFIKEAEKYTKEGFDDININDLYKDALSGNVDTKSVSKGVFKILGSEVSKTITSLGYILIIIIIHSIIKSISEGLGNNEIGQITYYVQYILIVTLIMSNFSETIVMIKETINNLVGFVNCLLPILLALMITTRKSGNSNSSAAHFAINYYIYRKFYSYNTFATYFNIYIFRNSI